jgi:hypothetical protein
MYPKAALPHTTGQSKCGASTGPAGAPLIGCIRSQDNSTLKEPLVAMKREIPPGDAAGVMTFEIVERMVINGSVKDRDDLLKRYERHESFDWLLAVELA